MKLLRADRRNEDAWVAYVATFSSFEGKLKALKHGLKSLPYSPKLTAVLQDLHRLEISDPRQNQNSAEVALACEVEPVMTDMEDIAHMEPDEAELPYLTPYEAELPYLTTVADEEAAAADNILRLRNETAAEPRNAELRFCVAINLVRCVPGLEGINGIGSSFWTSIASVESADEALNRRLASEARDCLPLEEGFQTARLYREAAFQELNTALAIGFTDLLIAAKARFLLIALSLQEDDLWWLSRGTHWSYKSTQAPIKIRLLPLRALADDIILDTARHLRRDPHDIQAISIQKAAYEFLGNQKGVGKSEQALQQARSMHTAGLRTKSSERERGASPGTRRRNDGLELEATSKQVLEKLGLEARTTQVTGDGGIDIEAYDTRPIFAGKYIIQCKDWEQPVGVTEVRELYGVMMDAGAIKGILISTGSFTKQAYEFAKGKPLELIDGEMLRGLISSLDTK
ncbi:MAG: restriction endonuclease [Planctomycetaceae bacterium]